MSKEVFPEIDIFPRLSRAARLVMGWASFLPPEPLAPHGDHPPTDVQATEEDYEAYERLFDVRDL